MGACGWVCSFEQKHLPPPAPSLGHAAVQQGNGIMAAARGLYNQVAQRFRNSTDGVRVFEAVEAGQKMTRKPAPLPAPLPGRKRRLAAAASPCPLPLPASDARQHACVQAAAGADLRAPAEQLTSLTPELFELAIERLERAHFEATQAWWDKQHDGESRHPCSHAARGAYGLLPVRQEASMHVWGWMRCVLSGWARGIAGHGLRRLRPVGDRSRPSPLFG